MSSKELLNALFESSSLRQDLLDQVKNAITDLIENTNLNDEVMARVSDETYNFVKQIKEEK